MNSSLQQRRGVAQFCDLWPLQLNTVWQSANNLIVRQTGFVKLMISIPATFRNLNMCYGLCVDRMVFWSFLLSRVEEWQERISYLGVIIYIVFQTLNVWFILICFAKCSYCFMLQSCSELSKLYFQRDGEFPPGDWELSFLGAESQVQSQLENNIIQVA